MVRIDRRWCALVPALLTLACGPSRGDTVLEQLQNEIAGIASRTRSAVVTIEDVRAVVVSYDTSPLMKQEIDKRIEGLTTAKHAADLQVAALRQAPVAAATDRLKVDAARHKGDQMTLQIAAQTRPPLAAGTTCREP